MSSSESTDILANQPAASETAAEAPPATPKTGATPTPPASEADLLAAAKKEAADNYNRYLRAVADLENFRRRTVREKDELRQFAASGVLEDLLPVIDNLGLALGAAQQPAADIKNLASGVEMVLAKLKSSLANHGLKEINPVGQAFDGLQL